jgi:hypothetical protein
VRTRVANISETGCNIQGHAFQAGSEVWLKITGLSPIRAKSIWTDGDRTGCEFYTPIALPLVDDLSSVEPKTQKRVLFGPGALLQPSNEVEES